MSATLRTKGRHLWLWTMIWSGCGFMGCSWVTMRRVGLGTDYARVRYLCTAGEYRQLLEPGAIPDNKYLPPFLRLDQRSHLDNDVTSIAHAPIIDLSLSEKDLYTGVPGLLPTEDRNEIEIKTPFFKENLVMLPVTEEARYVHRRLGLTPEQKERSPVTEDFV